MTSSLTSKTPPNRKREIESATATSGPSFAPATAILYTVPYLNTVSTTVCWTNNFLWTHYRRLPIINCYVAFWSQSWLWKNFWTNFNQLEHGWHLQYCKNNYQSTFLKFHFKIKLWLNNCYFETYKKMHNLCSTTKLNKNSKKVPW